MISHEHFFEGGYSKPNEFDPRQKQIAESEPHADIAGLELGEGLVRDETRAVGRRPASGAIQSRVVDNHQYAILRALNVELEVIRAELDGFIVSGNRMLWSNTGCTSVGDDDR